MDRVKLSFNSIADDKASQKSLGLAGVSKNGSINHDASITSIGYDMTLMKSPIAISETLKIGVKIEGSRDSVSVTSEVLLRHHLTVKWGRRILRMNQLTVQEMNHILLLKLMLVL